MAHAFQPLPPPLSPALAVLDDALELARFTRWTATPAGRRTAESSLRIGGMHCAGCSSAIEQALRGVDGVVDARVSAAARCATVQWDAARTRPSALVAAIAAAGYSAVPDTAGGARSLRRAESRDALWRLFVAVLCAMQVMMLAAPSYLDAGLAPDMKRLFDWGSWLLSLPVMVFAARPFMSGAWRSLRARRIGMDVPAALGMLVAFVASSGAAFAPGGAFGDAVYFDSLTMFVAFLLAGRTLEMRARHRAEAALEDSIGSLPETALRQAADDSVEAVSVLRLQPGDTVRVPLGQAFCADGVLTRGSTRADESLLTGESAPVHKAVGDRVVAGSLNLGAPVAMRVDRVGADTRYEAIVAMVRDARTRRDSAAPAGDRWAAPFLWAVLLLAGAAAAVWWRIDPARSVWVAVSVLIVTCPCALSLAAPSARLSAAMAMARRGLLLRRIDAIEGLARMDALFIDKTGTLTEARRQDLRMVRLGADPGIGDASLRQTAAALAGWSAHPLARVLTQNMAQAMPQPGDSGGEAPAWRELAELPGQGVQGRAADGSVWRLGRDPAALPAAGHSVAGDGAARDAGDDGARTWLSRDGVPLARFDIGETLRDGAAAAVQALQRDGVRIAIVSGDAPARVDRIGSALGIADRRGGMSPDDKLAALRAAQARGERVAMLGDGINDAPVLAQADTSLAMGEGAQIARAQADGVLVSNALGDLVRARALARETQRIVRQNRVWAVAYNAACVPLALAGWLPPWAAGLGMAGSSLVVVLNAMRLAK